MSGVFAWRDVCVSGQLEGTFDHYVPTDPPTLRPPSNKTQAIRASVLTLVAGINAPQVGAINASFVDVQLQLGAVVACLAPGGVTTATCSLPGMNARQRLEILVSEMQGRFDAAAADYLAYIVSE